MKRPVTNGRRIPRSVTTLPALFHVLAAGFCFVISYSDCVIYFVGMSIDAAQYAVEMLRDHA